LTEPTTLARVIVGSRLHGLALPDSDTDVRRVWVTDVAEMLSPWPPDAPEMAPEEDGWELRHFVGLLVKGNPTVLEVLASDLALGPVDPRWEDLRRLTPATLDPDALHRAHTGYIVSQRRLIEDARRRGDERRAAKAAVAALRIADQGADLLRSGVLPTTVTQHRDLLMEIRTDGLTAGLEDAWRRELDLAVAELDAAASNPHRGLAVDRSAVIGFLRSAYR